MNKEKVLFVIHRMSVGGSQISLVNALHNIDYEKYDVTLYIREPLINLLPEVPNQVRIVVNHYDKDYDSMPLRLNGKFSGKIKKKSSFVRNRLKKIEKHSFERMIEKKSCFEVRNHPELREKYDIAIAYLMEYVCRFVADYVQADKKVCFYHVSTDGYPEIHKKYLPQYDKVVAISQETADFLVSKYPQLTDKMIVIPNYINVNGILEKSKIEVPSKYNKDNIRSNCNNRLILCTCGRLSLTKGSMLALETARLLKRNRLDFIWLFVGEGVIKEEMDRKISEYDLTNNIIFTGLQMNPYPYIKMSDIYVQPSLEESQCLAIVEAQILGVPVITTDTVGGHNMVSDRVTGLIVSIDSESLASGVCSMVSDPDLAASIKENLGKIDFTEYNAECKDKWNKLLG